MPRPYNGTDHPAIAITSCPYCESPQGTPCHATGKRTGKFSLRRYTETHSARIKKAEKLTTEPKYTPGPWTAMLKPAPSRVDHGWRAMASCGLWIAAAPYSVAFKQWDNEANCKLIAAAPDGLKAAEMAYLHLLKTPHDALRIKGQDTLVALRDFIAKATGREAEDVQNEFESLAVEEMHNDLEQQLREAYKP